MDGWELFVNIVGSIIFIAWVPSMIWWLKTGVTIPRYLHVIAIIMTCLSLGCLVGLYFGGMATWKLALGMTLVPLAGTYFGWFWMFGPEFSKAGESVAVAESENR